MVNPQQFNSPEWNADWENFLVAKALEKGFTPAPTRVFSTRFKRENWEKRIDDIYMQADVNSPDAFKKQLTDINIAFKDKCPQFSKGAGNFPILRKYLLEEFSSVLPYEGLEAVLQPGALIRIKAPSKMGKTRLLNKFLAFAQQQEYQIVHINFLQIEASKFTSLNLFLRWFCTAISDALNLEIDLDQYWDEDRGSKQSCTKFLERILEDSPQPLVIGLDEVDRLLNYPDISQDFFYLLRYWHEEANNDELWEKLRLIVVYSTEDFGSLDINQSPFNVGVPIDLKPFDRQQIEELAQLYQLDLSNSEIEQLSALLGGHPYLVDLIMSHLISHPNIYLATLLDNAATDIGIYSSFLREYLIDLRANKKLSQVFLEVVNSQIPIEIDTLLAYPLYRMGLIKYSKSSNDVIPFCELYRLYFRERLLFLEETIN